MRNISIFLSLIFFSSCHQYLKYRKLKKINIEQVGTDTISNKFSNWVDALKSKSVDSIKRHYLPESIKVISSDSILSGPIEIAKYYASQKGDIKSISSFYKLQANKEKNIDYEIIKYENSHGESYAQLIIWKVKNAKRFREFEFVSEIENNINKNGKKLTEKRNLWVELCNTHNPKSLVNSLYSTSSIYFNHKPIIKGQESLIKEYSYMKDEKYKLTLNPLQIFFVNDKLVYELGQCEGTYKGKYIIVWKKESDGEWRVFIDSNI